MKTTKTVRASKKVEASVQRPVKSSRVIKADEEFAEEAAFEDELPADDVAEEVPDDEFEENPQSELLFEAGDVASIIAEVTGGPVDYTVDDETAEVTFNYGDDGEEEITVSADGDEEVVEMSTRFSGKKVEASRKVSASRKVRK